MKCQTLQHDGRLVHDAIRYHYYRCCIDQSKEGSFLVQLFFVIVRGVGFIDELLPLSVIDMFIFYFCKPAGLEAPHTQGDKVLK